MKITVLQTTHIKGGQRQSTLKSVDFALSYLKSSEASRGHKTKPDVFWKKQENPQAINNPQQKPAISLDNPHNGLSQRFWTMQYASSSFLITR